MHLEYKAEFDSRAQSRDVPPDVSLIVPAYNVAHYVEECLTSAFAALHGILAEVIIVNDGSTDGTHDVIMSVLARNWPCELLYIKQKNAGVSAARNLGLNLAKGEYIGFLDSDDLLMAGVVKDAVDFARHNACDVVMGRTLVFDSKTHDVYPFYDDWAWDRLLGGSVSKVVSRHGNPDLFYLEPNPNYRLISRKLFESGRLRFPEGRFFEDPPVHYEMLASSTRVGLMDIPYYWYRVARPGKTTADRSRKRFDILAVAAETIEKLASAELTDREGAAVLYGLIRIAWWCGTMLPSDLRHEFYGKACEIFSSMPPSAWVAAYPGQKLPEDIYYLIGSALLSGDRSRLIGLAAGRKDPVRSAYLLLRAGRLDLLMARAKRILVNFIDRRQLSGLISWGR